MNPPSPGFLLSLVLRKALTRKLARFSRCALVAVFIAGAVKPTVVAYYLTFLSKPLITFSFFATACFA